MQVMQSTSNSFDNVYKAPALCGGGNGDDMKTLKKIANLFYELMNPPPPPVPAWGFSLATA